MNMLKAILALTLTLFASSLFAQMSTPTLSSAYIGGSLGQAELDFDCEGEPCDQKDTAWRIFAGYQFHRSIAVELGYANFGDSIFGVPADQVTGEASAWDLSAVGAFPIGPVSIFGRLGLYRAETEFSDAAGSTETSSSGLVWGLGVQYDFTKNLGIRAEWQQYNDVEDDLGAETDVRVLNIGVLWRFQ